MMTSSKLLDCYVRGLLRVSKARSASLFVPARSGSRTPVLIHAGEGPPVPELADVNAAAALDARPVMRTSGPLPEAAVVPSPDPVRGLVPKAFVILKPGKFPDRELALEIYRFLRRRLAPYKRIRRLEFSDLPKTISGKIRRVELRKREQGRGDRERGPLEFWQEDFGELKG